IYKKRKNALSGDRLAIDLNTMFDSLTENIVMEHRSGGDYESFKRDVLASLGFEVEMDKAFFKEASANDVVELFQEQFVEQYRRKMEQVSAYLLPTIQQVYENEGHRYKRILVPFSDGGSRALPISAELE